MIHTVRVARMSDPERDLGDGFIVNPIEASLLYEGKGHVYQVSGPSVMNIGDETSYFSSSYISTPLKDGNGDEIVTQVNDLIEVLDHPDELVVGRVFRVQDVDAGGLFPVARRHMVSGAQRFSGWTWAL